MEPIIYGVIGVVLAIIVWGLVWLVKRTNHRAGQQEIEPDLYSENQLLSGIKLNDVGDIETKQPTRLHLVSSNAAISTAANVNKNTNVNRLAESKKSRPPIKRKNGAEVIKLVYSKNDNLAQQAKK
ncbi:hypothetical protein QWZ04_02750 [Vibrio tapetis subsp. quintayensis]|uniref:hypothetical protein n=1 Tax=Vibrio tapetis TaxID=52443 RepID=UPI0025B4B475|nr:hypothetical protein [Vibrio tapetis]MDN3679246.1 hypothetical protein [Vibrio tapetis subsp. quintayensis]